MNRFVSLSRALRESQTSAEARLWQALRNRSVGCCKFKRQWPIDRYVVDLVCLERKLVIEIDGATHSTELELSRDRQRTRTLESCGLQVLRVTNEDVRTNLAGVLETILAELDHRVHL